MVVFLFVTYNVNSNVRMAIGRVKSIFIAQSAILMTLLKLTTASFLTFAEFLFLRILYFLFQVGLKHANPNIGKIFKTNIILITKYLIVKSFILYQNMIDFK